MPIDRNTSAFPVNLEQWPPQSGMTLRDYFAAHALIAVVTCDYTVGPDKQAKWAFDLADAMMEARDGEATR